MAGRVKILLQAAAVLVVALLIALLGWQVVRADEGRKLASKVSAGQRPVAPDFELKLLHGDGKVRLSSLRGKVVVVNFWASWCIPCKEEAPVLEQGWRRWRDEGVQFLGVDVQDFAGEARRFVDRFGITYPTLFDGHGSTVGHWGVTGYPETWFVDRKGRLVVERIKGPVTTEKLDRNIEIALGTT
jgi:cytochrome c biogenesis protein CcmG, thiol:disulfide interchange protein DsbE